MHVFSSLSIFGSEPITPAIISSVFDHSIMYPQIHFTYFLIGLFFYKSGSLSLPKLVILPPGVI